MGRCGMENVNTWRTDGDSRRGGERGLYRVGGKYVPPTERLAQHHNFHLLWTATARHSVRTSFNKAVSGFLLIARGYYFYWFLLPKNFLPTHPPVGRRTFWIELKRNPDIGWLNMIWGWTSNWVDLVCWAWSQFLPTHVMKSLVWVNLQCMIIRLV